MYAGRAYALADSLRARGIRVVLGGTHASLVPVEAAGHADAVVVGEGESTWPEVLRDADADRLQSIYRAPRPPRPLDALPPQRVELLQHQRYMVHAVQSARGCTFDCEFCPTRTMFGEGFRLRDVDAVVDEVARLRALDDKPVFFTESVFGAADRSFIARLTARLKALSVRYGVVCDHLMLDREVVELLAAGGCRLVALNLTGGRKPTELQALRLVRGAGIPMWGYVMFGFEDDGPEVFQGALDVAREFRLAAVSLTVLAPYPGTPMGERLAAEGRVLSGDMSLYDQSHVLFRPARMSAAQLREGFERVYRELGALCRFERVVEAMNGTGG